MPNPQERFKVLTVVALLLTVAAAGCANVYEGTVTKKWYEPRRTYPVMAGKVMTMQVDDEDWVVEIEGCPREADEEPRECDKPEARWISLTRQSWEGTDVGEHMAVKP